MHLAAEPLRRHVAGRAAALAGIALLAAGLLAFSSQLATGFSSSSADSTLWQLLNADRTNNGVPALTRNATLASIASWRSKDMVERDYFSHTILGTSYTANHWYNLNGLNYKSWGENIAWNSGYSDADSPVRANEWLMNSSPHRHNILNAAFTHGGVGSYGADGVDWLGTVRNPRVYTELFMIAASSSGTRPPAPKPTPSELALQTDSSAAPTAGTSLDGVQVLVRVPVPLEGMIFHALRDLDPLGSVDRPADQERSYRVQRFEAAQRGMLDLLLGGRLEFLLG